MRKLLAYTFAWIAAITAGHLYLNVNWAVLMNDRYAEGIRPPRPGGRPRRLFNPGDILQFIAVQALPTH